VVSEPDDATRTLLRLGAYQLVFAGVAPHAAVSATVDLATRKTSGFVNAVLRKVSTVSMIWPNDAVRLSYPDWISERFHAEMSSDDAVAALERMNVPSPVSTRVPRGRRDRHGGRRSIEHLRAHPCRGARRRRRRGRHLRGEPLPWLLVHASEDFV
jgi:16S rRNA C967 or C1407 C5-methylase (RsmB/RsmF family)